ncbi:MAG: hypothetical protein MUE40_07980 [Anaerolineae bacterium]|jgi:hypothetical protein|nr:hypothetical protein [Anaerolineae bacterium]
MIRFGQVGIAIGTLGAVLAFMGLFPGLLGVEPTLGIGVVQVMLILVGYALLIGGGLLYLKVTFYLERTANLGQQIGIRLALTGLLFAALAGLADILGFGSHLRTASSDIFLGQLQAFGILGSFAISSAGVLLYALAGARQMRLEPALDPDRTQPLRKVEIKHVPPA